MGMLRRRSILAFTAALTLNAAALCSWAAFQAAGMGIVGYWKLDETATPSLDSSGNGISGTWINGPTSVSPGAPGITFPNSPGAMSFNGTNQYIDLGNPTALPAGTAARSMCGWAKSATTAGGYRWIMAYGTGGTGQAMFIGMNGTTLYGGGYGDDITVANYWDTNWHFIALTYDGTTARLYADGVEKTNAAKNWNLVRSLAYIGKQVNGAAEYWNGQIDDVRVYNRVLTPAEITDLAAGKSGPNAPTNLIGVAGDAQVSLSWTGQTGVTYNVLRATVSGGPYTTIASNLAVTTYLDTAVTNGTTYYYVVTAVSYGEGPKSNEVACTPVKPAVTALPNTGLQTSENLTTTTFTITYNVAAPGGGSVLTVTSTNLNEGTVSANGLVTTPVAGGFQYTVAAGAKPTIVVTITGVDDTLVDGNITYPINVTATNMGLTIPNVMCTNNDNDIQGLTFSRTSGLVTTESGGQATFDVYLNRQPFNNVSFTLMSSNTLEGTVTPGSLTFTNATGALYSPGTGVGGWNVAHTVTVTGVDDTLLDFTQAYSIITGTLTFVDPKDQAAFTAAGVTAAPDVSCSNLDNEVPPALPHVWGGGCGLLGPEFALPWLLARLLRRRRRT